MGAALCRSRPSVKVPLKTTEVRIVALLFVVWCGKTMYSCSKNVSDPTCAIFDAGKLLQHCTQSGMGVETFQNTANTHRSENHQTLQFSILLRFHSDLKQNV